MSLFRPVRSMVQRAALSAVVGIVTLGVLAGAAGFLVAAFYAWLAELFDVPVAAAITGGALLVIAMFIGVTGRAALRRMKRRQPSLLAGFGGTIGLTTRVIAAVVRRDPKKALIVSIIAGALAEYVLAERDR